MTEQAGIILASSSPYRRALMGRLKLPFTCQAPDIDESRLAGEPALAMVERLAGEKALAVAENHPDSLVIGADEVAVVDDHILTKPGGHERAAQQLRLVSGRVVRFLTGVCLLNSRTGNRQLDTVVVEVAFRQLTDAEIERYLEADKPYDSAGSFKAEAGGITLVRRISSDDDTSLLGLPLISLQEMLRNEGYEIP